MRLIMNPVLRVATLSALMATSFFLASAQGIDDNKQITLPARKTTRQTAIVAIEHQTDYKVAYHRQVFNDQVIVDFGKTNMALRKLLGKLIEGSNHTYTSDGKYIIIHNSDARPEVSEEIDDYTVLPSATGIYGTVDPLDELHTERPTEVKTTAYFVANDPTRHTTRSFADEPKTTYSFVPAQSLNNNRYLPKAAIKTNLLYLATTTPNIAVEFGLARKWTLDIAAGLNPWDLNNDKGGIRHAIIQPEFRYWFCNRFERHFVGPHGMYGRYQIHNIDLKPFGNDLTDKRYEGWGAGGGISYGYHLPVGKRWAWEFTAGAGYVYLEYNKYRCGTCDQNLGKHNKHYLGLTKAGISLIYMLK